MKQKETYPLLEHKETDPEPAATAAGALLCLLLFLISFYALFISLPILIAKNEENVTEDITIAFMNLTTSNITKTSFNANWNLSTRVPKSLPGSSLCLQGDFQASLLYKNITITTSPPKSYGNLQPNWPQLLKVSGVISNDYINGAIGKSILDDIKETSEVKFELLLFLPDCRQNTTGTMTYFCDEVKLPFHSNFQKITTTVVGNPICRYNSRYNN